MSSLKIKEKNTKSMCFFKVKFYDYVLWKNYLSVIGIISSIITLLSFFVTADKIGFISVKKISVFFVIILLIIFAFMWYEANKKQSVNLKINDTNVKISEGDIFELLERDPEKRRGELSIIGVNDFYDTIVDNDVIAEETLHGQYINKLQKMGKLDQLEDKIKTDDKLNRKENSKYVLEREKGKKIRYRLGSVVEFENYVLTAFAKFDEDNKAYLSSEDYVGFWMRFWKNIDEIYAGRTLNIPLMGAGIARFRDGKPTKQELLEVMLLSLKLSGFHNTYSDKQINIVIYKSDVKDIDFYHIQHNLSLR